VVAFVGRAIREVEGIVALAFRITTERPRLLKGVGSVPPPAVDRSSPIGAGDACTTTQTGVIDKAVEVRCPRQTIPWGTVTDHW